MAARILLYQGLFKHVSSPIVGRAFISQFEKHIIGNRDVVGYGYNGQPWYVDRADFPFPAIRWKESTADILALREKEKGDWRKLSIDEKRELYRASFCETFAEFKAPTHEWRSVVGGIFMLFTLSIWFYYFTRAFVTNIPLPDSFEEDNRRAQLRRMIDLHVNPIDGLSSWWDYENDCWKVKP